MSRWIRFDEVEGLLRTARLELDAARSLSKSQAEALVDVAESEKAATRTAQVCFDAAGGEFSTSTHRACMMEFV